jgi:hypothetical protein
MSIIFLFFKERKREEKVGDGSERHYIGGGVWRKQYLWFRRFPGSAC